MMNEYQIEMLRMVIRREEQRRTETAHKMVSSGVFLPVVSHKKVIEALRLRYPGTQHRYWMVLFSIIYTGTITKKILGYPYFIYGVANKIFGLQGSWRRTDIVNYWQSHGLLIKDYGIVNALKQAQHPWANLTGRLKASSTFVFRINESIADQILADYAEEMNNFTLHGIEFLEQTPIFNDPRSKQQITKSDKVLEERFRRDVVSPKGFRTRETDGQGNVVDFIANGYNSTDPRNIDKLRAESEKPPRPTKKAKAKRRPGRASASTKRARRISDAKRRADETRARELNKRERDEYRRKRGSTDNGAGKEE